MNELKNLKIAFHTLGCKVNMYESAVMQDEVKKAGAIPVEFSEEADLYIVNTCSVTNMADRKSRQMLHRAKKKNPNALVIATGCYVETENAEQILENGVDLLLGNEAKKDIVKALREFLDTRNMPVNPDISKVKSYTKECLTELLDHTRADVKIQDGCNQFCTYCIIPFARGRIRSKRPEDVVSEIEGLVKKGVTEFVLTGIHLSSYGLDFSEDGMKITDYKAALNEEINLLTLIQKVHEIEGVKRLRIGSLEPRIMTEEFARTLASLPKVCPHFHLALQSGARETLKRMNRHYTPEDYRAAVENLRAVYDRPAITTDVITGFPGETEEEFEESKRFFTETGFFEPNIFPYSRRRGTVADKMKNQVPDAVKKARTDAMLRLGEESSKAYSESLVGKETEALSETQVPAEKVPEEVKKSLTGTVYSGHTREFLTVYMSAESPNEVRTGVIRKAGPYYVVE